MSARRQFLAECGRAAAAFVLMACEQDKVVGPETCEVRPQSQPVSTVRDVYVTDSGALTGSTYPARTAEEFDALLAFLKPNDSLAVHFRGSFQTRGVYRWGQYANRNLGKGWTVDGVTEISLVPDIKDGQPLYCLAGPASRVSGITTRGNHSSLAGNWPTSLRTGGVLLENGSMDGVTFRDFGAIGAETFVAEIVGSGDITNCLYTDHDPSSSDNQVSVFRTMGSENGEAFSPTLSVHEGNTVNAPGSKKVQAHTIYQSPGLVRRNKSIGADLFYYGDYWKSRRVTIEENAAVDSLHGVQLRLSQTAGDNTELPKYFSHEDYTIGWNRFQSSGKQVSLIADEPVTDTRFIRNIWIHPDLSVENFGATGVRRELSCRMAA